jgi:hypothetical protein
LLRPARRALTTCGCGSARTRRTPETRPRAISAIAELDAYGRSLCQLALRGYGGTSVINDHYGGGVIADNSPREQTSAVSTKLIPASRERCTHGEPLSGTLPALTDKRRQLADFDTLARFNLATTAMAGRASTFDIAMATP